MSQTWLLHFNGTSVERNKTKIPAISTPSRGSLLYLDFVIISISKLDKTFYNLRSWQKTRSLSPLPFRTFVVLHIAIHHMMMYSAWIIYTQQPTTIALSV